jgi:hypothetical protein
MGENLQDTQQKGNPRKRQKVSPQPGDTTSTPNSGSTQPPTADTTQTPSPGSTQTPTASTTQTPSPGSTQPPTSSTTQTLSPGYPYPPYPDLPSGYPQPYPGSTPDSTDTPKPPKRQGWTDEEKRALKAKITEQAAVLTFCLKTAKEQFGDYCRTEESLINLAIALYTGAVKRN